jgi:predicted DCC family thiol-disulfide oxidoreductase YuxK
MFVAGSLTSPRKRLMAALPERATVIYDGDCDLCRQAIARVRAWDREGQLDYVAFQEASVQRFGIELPALAAAMHLVLPDGRVFAGADAVPRLLKRLPGKRWLAALFSVPGVLPVARRVYRRIAERRHCLIRGLPTHGSNA